MDYLYALPSSLQVIAFFKEIADYVLGQAAEKWPDLTVNQVRLLLAVDDSVQMKELAERLAITPSNLTPLVASCIKEGLAEKRPSETDGRSMSVQLSEHGQTLRDEIIHDIAEIIRDASSLSEETFAKIQKLIGDGGYARIHERGKPA